MASIEKQSGFRGRTKETTESKETGIENLHLAIETVNNAGKEIQKGIEALGSNDISPASKSAIRSKIAAVAGVLLALMLCDIAHKEESRHEDTVVQTSPDVPSESEAPPLGRVSRRSQETRDPEAQLEQKFFFGLATVLREHELGIERVSKEELARLVGETAVENALQELGGSGDGHDLAERIRREIEDSCSAPECDTEKALLAAGAALTGHVDQRYELASG